MSPPGAAAETAFALPRRSPLAAAAQELRVFGAAVDVELRKATAFRAGFFVREVLVGVDRPAVMLFLFAAMFRSSGAAALGGFTFPELVHYMLWVATFQKLLAHERLLDLSEHVFDGTITKFLVMPFRPFTLVLARFAQYTAIQAGVALVFWTAGRLLLPRHWPEPAGAVPLIQALVLVLLGSYCTLLVYFLVNALAFWLDVVWTLLVMSRFVIGFLAGSLIPVSMMPGVLPAALELLFPYWTLSAPIEIAMGRLGTAEFVRGVAILGVSAATLQALASAVWRRGLRRYTGVGM